MYRYLKYGNSHFERSREVSIDKKNTGIPCVPQEIKVLTIENQKPTPNTISKAGY